MGAYFRLGLWCGGDRSSLFYTKWIVETIVRHLFQRQSEIHLWIVEELVDSNDLFVLIRCNHSIIYFFFSNVKWFILFLNILPLIQQILADLMYLKTPSFYKIQILCTLRQNQLQRELFIKKKLFIYESFLIF